MERTVSCPCTPPLYIAYSMAFRNRRIPWECYWVFLDCLVHRISLHLDRLWSFLSVLGLRQSQELPMRPFPSVQLHQRWAWLAKTPERQTYQSLINKSEHEIKLVWHWIWINLMQPHRRPVPFGHEAKRRSSFLRLETIRSTRLRTELHNITLTPLVRTCLLVCLEWMT